MKWSCIRFSINMFFGSRYKRVLETNRRSCQMRSFLLKVSAYPFKQNKNMLKNMPMLLHTYFYNISLNELRPTFFNIYNLPFSHSPNIGKIWVKVGPKTNHFSYILSSCTNRIAVFNNFFHWYVANQETNKTVPAIFFFPNIFWIIF